MGGGGKGGGGGSVPYQNEMSQMMMGSLANRLLRSDPAMSSAFNKPDSALGSAYSDIFGKRPVKYEGFGTVPKVGTLTAQAMQGVYGKPTAHMKGAGAYSPVPTGEMKPMATPTYKPQYGASTLGGKVNPVAINPKQFQLAQQVGMETIGQGAKQAQSQLMQQMGARGLGQSGLAAQEAIKQYQRGAGQQASQLGRSLASERMGLEHQAGLQAQQLDLERRYKMAGLSADEAKTRADLEMRNRAQNLQTATGLGQLGLQERQQGLSELSAQRSWEDAPLSALAGLGQSAMAANANGGGKGGK